MASGNAVCCSPVSPLRNTSIPSRSGVRSGYSSSSPTEAGIGPRSEPRTPKPGRSAPGTPQNLRSNMLYTRFGGRKKDRANAISSTCAFSPKGWEAFTASISMEVVSTQPSGARAFPRRSRPWSSPTHQCSRRGGLTTRSSFRQWPGWRDPLSRRPGASVRSARGRTSGWRRRGPSPRRGVLPPCNFRAPGGQRGRTSTSGRRSDR